MAILQEVPGVAVTIRVNDVDCVEYDDPNASEQPLDKPTSSKYIESPDDAEYTIHIKIDSAYDWSYKNHMMGVTAASDGLHISSDVFTKDNEVTERDISAREEFCQDTNHWHSRKPMFSRVKIGTSDVLCKCLYQQNYLRMVFKLTTRPRSVSKVTMKCPRS